MNDPIESTIPSKMRDIAPEFVEYGENILYEKVWRDSALTSKERSLITLSSLISMGNTEQLPFHLQLVRKHGLTEKEISALITHIAFYAGWPRASSAVNVLLKEKE